MFRKPESLILFLIVFCSSALVDGLFAHGEVSFIARRDYRMMWRVESVAVGDFNGDAIQDLAVVDTYPPFPSGQPSTMSILLGNGDRTFRATEEAS